MTFQTAPAFASKIEVATRYPIWAGDQQCHLCGGITPDAGPHYLCIARAKRGMPTPTL